MGGRLRRWLAPVALLASLLALVATLMVQQRLGRSERELARRLQGAEAAQRDAAAQLKYAQEALRDMQARNALLEARVSETAGHQAQLDKLYQDIARNRDDWTVAEVESAVVAAAQQLQLSGNVRGALLALQDADARLAASSHPPLLGLRRVLARDIERLRALPSVDPAGLAVRLDTIIGAVDQMPMLSDPKPESAHRAEDAPAAAGGTFRERLARAGGAGWATLRDELADLVRIRRVDRPDALLLAPEQAYFVRENLKLRLTAARTSLLARQESAYRADLGRAVETIERNFDDRSRQVANALGVLRSMRDSPHRLELPVLTESLAAVRQLRGRETP